MYVEFRRGKDTVIIDKPRLSSTYSHLFVIQTTMDLFRNGQKGMFNRQQPCIELLQVEKSLLTCIEYKNFPLKKDSNHKHSSTFTILIIRLSKMSVQHR